jgi:hypothetical protein
MYGMGSANIGRGIVGGYVSGAEGNGKRMGEMVRQILDGERPQDIPIESSPAGPMFDWRQLRRRAAWSDSESCRSGNYTKDESSEFYLYSYSNPVLSLCC